MSRTPSRGWARTGERSIVLLSDGGDTVENQKGGDAREAAQLKAAVTALTRGKVRAEVVAFKSAGGQRRRCSRSSPTAGGGSVATAGNQAAVAAAFDAAARTLESQVAFTVERPPGLTGVQTIEVKGVASGSPFTATAPPRPGRRGTGRGADRRRRTCRPSTVAAGTSPSTPLTTKVSGVFLPLAVLALFLGVFLLVLVAFAPVFRSQRKERIATIEAYGLGRARPETKAPKASPSAISQSLVDMGEQFMSGRESTSRTMALLDRADLPWRAGEWFVLRILAVVVGGLVGLRRPCCSRNPVVGLVMGVVAGFVLPAVILRILAKRRANKFEFVLPDVLMLTATSLASGFSLLQALDAVARDAPGALRQGVLAGPGRDPDRRRRLGRPRAHGRPHGQQQHALGDHGDPHPARRRWQPGRDAAHHRGDAARARGAAPPRQGAVRRGPALGLHPHRAALRPALLLDVDQLRLRQPALELAVRASS